MAVTCRVAQFGFLLLMGSSRACEEPALSEVEGIWRAVEMRSKPAL